MRSGFGAECRVILAAASGFAHAFPPQNSLRDIKPLFTLLNSGSVQLLYEAMAADLKRELKAKKADLMTKLADMPDSQLQARACDCKAASSDAHWALTLLSASMHALRNVSRHKRQLQKPGLTQSNSNATRLAWHVQIKWELGSPIFGFLLRKYAPHDTYQARCCLAALMQR
jgi:hypothetical protein